MGSIRWKHEFDKFDANYVEQIRYARFLSKESGGV